MTNQTTRVIPVTHAEFEQFMYTDTLMPECAQLNGDGVPTCAGKCPAGYVCATFSYQDSEHGVDNFWYACAAPEIVERLASRAIMVDMSRPTRRVKYIAYPASE